jgi:DNA-binding NtrC family response regulator
MLVEYFVQRYAKKAGKNIRTIEKKTLERLQAYDWPGNIRELQNVIERSVILRSGDIFAVDEVWLPNQTPLADPRAATTAILSTPMPSRALNTTRTPANTSSAKSRT